MVISNQDATPEWVLDRLFVRPRSKWRHSYIVKDRPFQHRFSSSESICFAVGFSRLRHLLFPFRFKSVFAISRRHFPLNLRLWFKSEFSMLNPFDERQCLP